MRCTTMGAWLAVFCALLAQQARGAAYGDDLGYISLTNELNASNTPVPNGAGVNVTQVESPLNGNGAGDFAPDPTNSEFSGKTITTHTSNNAPVNTSTHATSVGTYFYGNSTSMSPGITSINVYNANYWIGSAFLNGDTSALPDVTTDRVGNHSYIGFADSNTLSELHHFDYLIQHDDYINVVAVNNPNNGGIAPILSSAFNSISVGLSNGTAVSGTGTLDSLYVSGRAEPDIVVPQGATSFSTPTVSSVAADLVQYAHTTPALSNGTFTSPRTGLVLEYAETADVIKAALMAGAVRNNINDTASQQVSYYTPGFGGVQNGLDSRYGAGQLNIDNSYHVLAGHQQTPGNIGTYGFDYNPTAPANASTNFSADYKFTGHTAVASSLVWNAHVDDSLVATLAHFTLTLYLINADNSKTTVVSSASPIDNTQNIFVPFLNPTANYELEVTRTDQLADNWDYSLAWNLSSVPEPGTIALFDTAIVSLLSRRPRRSNRDGAIGKSNREINS